MGDADAHVRDDPRPRAHGLHRLPLARVLGRRHVRRVAALPGRRPLGAPAPDQEARRAHAAADAAPRPEPRRLPPLRRRHRAPVRLQGGRERHGHLPRLRRPQRHPQLRDRRRGDQGDRQALPGRRRLHDLPGALARPLRRRRARARGHGRRLHLHQGHGGAALAVLRRAARRPPQGRAQGAHPAPLPLHRRPRPDDLPQGHRGRRGRHRHGHGAARLRQLAAGHRDGRVGAHGYSLRQRPRPREALRDGQVLREGAGSRVAGTAASRRSPTCRSTRTRCRAA